MMTVTEPTWLTRSEAIAAIQCSPVTFAGLLRMGRIRTRDFGFKRYWAEDVRRLANPPEPQQETTA